MPFWSKPKDSSSSPSSSSSSKKKNSGSSSSSSISKASVLAKLGKKAQQRFSEDEGYSTSTRGSRNSFESPKVASSEATSLSPSNVGTRTPSFAEHMAPRGQPLPLPSEVACNVGGAGAGAGGRSCMNQIEFRHHETTEDGTVSGYGSVSMSSTSSVSSEIPEWHNLPPLRKNLRQEAVVKIRPTATKTTANSPKRPAAKEQMKSNLHLNVPARSAPTSMFSSPCHSPRRLSSADRCALLGVQGMVPPENRLSPSSYSAYNSSVTETAASFLISPEKSPLASPMRSPGPSSRTQSGAVSPLHMRSGHGTDSPGGHRLPSPRASAFSNSAVLSPSSSHHLSSPTIRWQKGSLLGYGSFGNVYKGFSNSGAFCAMKEVLIVDDPKSKESVKQLMQEINMLSSLRHPNIVQYLGSEMLEDRLYIYLEYVSGGSIQKVLQEYGAFKEPVIRSYTQQILSGLAYLHSMNKVHRDIKGANILVDTNGEVKLADFGMAKTISSQSSVLSFKGSPYWMAPEVFKNTNIQRYPVDIWSLGCTVIEMATGKPPWSQFEGVAAMFKIGNSKEIPEIPEELSQEAQEFLRLCLQRDPEDRPSAAQLLEHPFVKLAYDETFTASPRTMVSDRNAFVGSPHSRTGFPGTSTPGSPNGRYASTAHLLSPNGRMRSDVVLRSNVATSEASPRRRTIASELLGAAFDINSREACRYYDNGPLGDRPLSPLLTRYHL